MPRPKSWEGQQVARGARRALARRIALLINLRRPKPDTINVFRLCALICEHGLFVEGRDRSLAQAVFDELAPFGITVKDAKLVYNK